MSPGKAQAQTALETGNRKMLVSGQLALVFILIAIKFSNPISFQGRGIWQYPDFAAFAPMVHIGALEEGCGRACTGFGGGCGCRAICGGKERLVRPRMAISRQF